VAADHPHPVPPASARAGPPARPSRTADASVPRAAGPSGAGSGTGAARPTGPARAQPRATAAPRAR